MTSGTSDRDTERTHVTSDRDTERTHVTSGTSVTSETSEMRGKLVPGTTPGPHNNN